MEVLTTARYDEVSASWWTFNGCHVPNGTVLSDINWKVQAVHTRWFRVPTTGFHAHTKQALVSQSSTTHAALGLDNHCISRFFRLVFTYGASARKRNLRLFLFLRRPGPRVAYACACVVRVNQPLAYAVFYLTKLHGFWMKTNHSVRF